MHIVINIDEEVYKRTLPYKDLPVISNLANDYDEITHAVANGVPLPKGHGRIADIDAAIKCIEEVEGEDAIWAISLIEWACSKRTIIEADKAESED